MLRLCIIDDEHRVVKELTKWLKKPDLCKIVDWDNYKAISFPTEDEKTGHIYEYDEQIEMVYDCICKNWDLFDLLLLDWSLLGKQDENKNAIGVKVLHRLFKNNSKYKAVIKEEKKFILIVTGKNTKRIDFSFEEIDNKIICVDKPSREEREINKSSCRCSTGVLSKPCKLYENNNLKCMKNDCLPEIIKMINSIKDENHE